MEEGSMRCDANVSVMLVGAEDFGTKVEVKNMNSIRNVQRAIEFEIIRQIEALENGEPLTQETRAFDALKGITISMRTKEAANDYRYFPEPDLPPITVSTAQIADIAKEMPALPNALFERYTQTYGLSAYDAYNITDQKGLALYYEALISATKNYKAAANWLMGEIKSYLNEQGVDISAFPIACLMRSRSSGEKRSSAFILEFYFRCLLSAFICSEESLILESIHSCQHYLRELADVSIEILHIIIELLTLNSDTIFCSF
jgi:aspartyl-tRNA(Asn)/glutamyl-tRNA(Gln) amidotransferase subunit B